MAKTPVPAVQPKFVARPNKPKFPKSRLIKGFKIFSALVAIVAVGFLIWQYVEARKDVKRLSDPQKAGQLVNDELTDRVSKLTIVPKDEKPTIANVSDASKLKDPLFALAENGDKVVYYTNARRLIIYRPSTNVIITVVTRPAEDLTKPAQ